MSCENVYSKKARKEKKRKERNEAKEKYASIALLKL